mgnify:CR=1 FL=1
MKNNLISIIIPNNLIGQALYFQKYENYQLAYKTIWNDAKCVLAVISPEKDTMFMFQTLNEIRKGHQYIYLYFRGSTIPDDFLN